LQKSPIKEVIFCERDPTDRSHTIIYTDTHKTCHADECVRDKDREIHIIYTDTNKTCHSDGCVREKDRERYT